jgi:hypothetical protein
MSPETSENDGRKTENLAWLLRGEAPRVATVEFSTRVAPSQLSLRLAGLENRFRLSSLTIEAPRGHLFFYHPARYAVAGVS